jgi:hypothetical protein
VHVTLRLADDVPSLRNYERAPVLRKAFCEGARRHGVAPARNPDWIDPFSSARYFDGWATAPPKADRESEEALVVSAESWLLTVGWRRHGLIRFDEVPGRMRR